LKEKLETWLAISHMAVIYKWRVHKSPQLYMLRYLFYLLLQTLLTNENTWRPNWLLVCSKAS